MTVEILPVKVSEISSEEFEEVKSRIFPIVKSNTWFGKINDIIKSVQSKNIIISEITGKTDVVVGYVIENLEDDCRTYISEEELKIWGVDELTLKEIALDNLRSLIDRECKKGRSIIRETQTGILFSDQLDDFSASLALLEEFPDIVQIQQDRIVGFFLRSDFFICCSSTNRVGLCLLREITLRQNGDMLLSNVPLRLVVGNFIPYEPVENEEYEIPNSRDELLQLKRDMFDGGCK